MTKNFLISVALVSISFLAGCASNPKNEESCFEVRKTSMTVATLRYELGAPKAQAAEMASQNVHT
jgi:outer membrane murein-binding lipoprotein Lpp